MLQPEGSLGPAGPLTRLKAMIKEMVRVGIRGVPNRPSRGDLDDMQGAVWSNQGVSCI